VRHKAKGIARIRRVSPAGNRSRAYRAQTLLELPAEPRTPTVVSADVAERDSWAIQKRLKELSKLLEQGEMSEAEFSQERRRLLSPVAPARTADAPPSREARPATVAPAARASSAPKPIDDLAKRTRRHLSGALRDGDQVRAVVKGHSQQALILLDDRVVIVKPGFQAGAGIGAKVTTLPLRQIQGVNVRSAVTSAGLEVLSAAFPATLSRLSSGSEIRRALYESPNCLPLSVVDEHVNAVVNVVNSRAGR
jgi:hypothetical protein